MHRHAMVTLCFHGFLSILALPLPHRIDDQPLATIFPFVATTWYYCNSCIRIGRIPGDPWAMTAVRRNSIPGRLVSVLLVTKQRCRVPSPLRRRRREFDVLSTYCRRTVDVLIGTKLCTWSSTGLCFPCPCCRHPTLIEQTLFPGCVQQWKELINNTAVSQISRLSQSCFKYHHPVCGDFP